MKRGEIPPLEQKDIVANTIHIKHSMVELENGEWSKKRSKTYSGDGYIECPFFCTFYQMA